MASKKKGNKSAGRSSSQSGTDKKPQKNGETSGKSRQTVLSAPEDSLRCQIVQFTLGILAALLLLILLLTDLRDGRADSATGLVGYYLCAGLYGLFGRGVWAVLAALVYLTVFWRRAIRTRTATAKCVAASLVVLITSSLFFSFFTLNRYDDLPAFYNVAEMWKLALPRDGSAINVGGIIGALFGGLLNLLFRKVSWLIALLILIGAMLILIEVPPMRAIRAIGRAIRRFFLFIKTSAQRRAQQKAEEEEDDTDEPVEDAEPAPRPRLFPEDTTERSGEPGSRGRSVGITPIDYTGGKKVREVPDPPITTTLPPVLPEDLPKKKEDQPPYSNPYADPAPGKSDEKADPNLLGLLFSGEDELDPPVGGDVNVTPRRPGTVENVAASDPAPVRVGTAVQSTEAEQNKPKTTEERFNEITDLQESDENDHALTDPDLAEPDEIKPKAAYKFPPFTLLRHDVGGMNADHSAELQANGVKLVNVLESFKVRTKITNISRGPTITRYELMPDQGVRVRAIANLVDDIALNLATSGVRIEAPIPGKPAVGIEVPNANKETVYLRDLLENPMFEQAGSKLTAALGMDVAGEPIFVDIAKMPHLLIAGTTGSGKSICIDSLITSLLFRATPDEVKLILIDPKMVEFKSFSGLPHLLVPVVNNPKKAAGALTWAVSEMEKRYEAIEQAGSRDIKGYNKLIENGDITGEKMPYIVIVIDELADLMMTAPDTIEESICRLAQKARAAGMHLIIGTQRPSVDVITGLIKANIPSRIAMTVMSVVDSRTIIDIAGAEKLIGHGDMLYAPVGAMKPIRVQGTLVEEDEVKAIRDFIQAQVGEPVYDQKTIDEIREHEAECEEVGKKGSFSASSGDDEEEDPKFVESVRLAVESGKISTSLLQRRMGLGYGRAAKIIDRMEQMGIVSAPDGQKPRNVLMNMQEFQEMIMHTKE